MTTLTRDELENLLETVLRERNSADGCEVCDRIVLPDVLEMALRARALDLESTLAERDERIAELEAHAQHLADTNIVLRACVKELERLTTPRSLVAEQIATFISVFDRLDGFEVQQRIVRGYGVWGPGDLLPNPDVIAVLTWLKKQAGLPLPSDPAEKGK